MYTIFCILHDQLVLNFSNIQSEINLNILLNNIFIVYLHCNPRSKILVGARVDYNFQSYIYIEFDQNYRCSIYIL